MNNYDRLRLECKEHEEQGRALRHKLLEMLTQALADRLVLDMQIEELRHLIAQLPVPLDAAAADEP